MNTGIKVREVLESFVSDHSMGEYNLSVWRKNIRDMKEYRDVKWYYAEPQNGTDYDRFFIEYTIPEGLRLLKSFSFSYGLTSNGFTRAFIANGEIITRGFGEKGTDRIINSKQGRKWLIENICKHGCPVSNEL